MKTVLYMHGGSKNHGCEALVRTTAKLVENNINLDVYLWSYAKSEEHEYGINNVVKAVYGTDELNKKSLSFLLAYFKYKILKNPKAFHNAFIKKLFSKSVAISIGGDNYCYPWSAKDGVILDEQIRKYCYKNVLWGCSIEDEFITADVEADLKGFDLITVRESLSYNILKKHNIDAVQVADPAFLLNKKELPLPEGFIKNNTVGINISPLINDYESDGNIAFENYINLIQYIITETDMNVCLIPHVVWKDNNDFKPINALYDIFKNSGRVIKLNDSTCEELKGYISRCRFFVGARTHATIAAYSSCVPTLVVGYSIKAKGIAKDLFGKYDNYVVSVQNMKQKYDLTNAFTFIYKNECMIKKRLQDIMPEYKKEAELSGEKLKEIVRL